MYESFYGLKEKPFDLHPDPDYLYMSPGHENVYTHLDYAVQENKGFVIVTGEVGSGKTTLINYLIRKIPASISVGIINNTFVHPTELLRMICQEYELEIENADKTVLLQRFYNYLLEQYAKRERVILIIDEAQNLPDKSLEEIRMLSNLEAEKHHLIQMILVGQPQLKQKLQKKNLEQFVQRVTVHCHLDALDKAQVAEYVRHRLSIAGAQEPNIFDQEALEAIYRHSGGIPRLINTLCDAAFVYGYADGVKVIGRELIEAGAESRNMGGREDVPESIPEKKQGVADLVDGTPDWLRELQARIFTLEGKLASWNGSREEWDKKVDERDRKISELYTMLNESMRGHQEGLVDRERLQKRVDLLTKQLTENMENIKKLRAEKKERLVRERAEKAEEKKRLARQRVEERQRLVVEKREQLSRRHAEQAEERKRLARQRAEERLRLAQEKKAQLARERAEKKEQLARLHAEERKRLADEKKEQAAREKAERAEERKRLARQRTEERLRLAQEKKAQLARERAEKKEQLARLHAEERKRLADEKKEQAARKEAERTEEEKRATVEKQDSDATMHSEV